MNKRTFLTTIILGACCAFPAMRAFAQDVDSVRPVVVKTVPEAGTRDVTPGVVDIKVTFSKPMMNGSWSWSTAWENSAPEIVGKPRYEKDGKTCVLTVTLEPNKTYGWWINSDRFTNFKDTKGRPAVPYLFVFKTKSE